MKKTANFRIFLGALSFFAVLLLGACGDDVTKVRYETSDNTNMSLVAFDWEKDRVLCDSSKQGTFMYFDGESADSAGKVSAYVCVDSVWVPLQKFPSSAEGVDSASCKAQELSDGSGYRVVCAGDSAGLLLNGKNGSDGIACTVSELSDGSGYKIICGEDSVGVVRNGAKGTTVNQCSVLDDGKGTITQICGTDTTTLVKALCGETPYDPAKSICDTRNNVVYRTVKIGTQIWMAENLNYEYNSGTAKSVCYENSADSCAKYGRLYTWSAAMDSAGIFSADGEGCGYGSACTSTDTVNGGCPQGWTLSADGKMCTNSKRKESFAVSRVRGICPESFHIPDMADLQILGRFIADSLYGGDAGSVGYALKSVNGWTNKNGSDVFGFGELPAGAARNILDDDEQTVGFMDVGRVGFLWSSTGHDEVGQAAYAAAFDGSSDMMDRGEFDKIFYFSVRCVK